MLVIFIVNKLEKLLYFWYETKIYAKNTQNITIFQILEAGNNPFEYLL